MASVTVDQVTIKYGNTKALDNISLHMDDGEFLVMLGPTGAGKTTTLRTIAGLEKPTSGTIKIGGVDVTQFQPARRDVAMVFQEYSLYPHFSVYENLAFPLRSPLRRVPEELIKEKILKVARLLKIEQKLDNKCTNLSGGEMQRVAIGRALVREPAAFLMDEPLSSLDAKLRDDLRVELKRIQIKLNATICYVTHDQMEAMTLADRIGVLSEGRLLQLGTPHEIYMNPVNVYVACRLGSPQINLLTAGAFGLIGPADAVTLGIRPESILLGDKGQQTQIDSVMYLGTETVLKIMVNGQKAAVLAPPGKSFTKGESIKAYAIPETVLYFDENGNRVYN